MIRRQGSVGEYNRGPADSVYDALPIRGGVRGCDRGGPRFEHLEQRDGGIGEHGEDEVWTSVKISSSFKIDLDAMNETRGSAFELYRDVMSCVLTYWWTFKLTSVSTTGRSGSERSVLLPTANDCRIRRAYR